MSAHTPGPWRVADLGNGKYYGTNIESPCGVVVHRLGSVTDDTPSERASRNDYDSHYEKAETLANARLIAAAPDLYEALRGLRALIIGECGASTYECFDGERADAAIRKAEGKV